MPLAHQANLADMRFNDLFIYMQEWLGKWHILQRQNKIDLLRQCHRVVRSKRLDHMCDADVTNSERRKLWELVGWLLCVLYGYRHYHWSSEEFLELKQISSEACGVTDTDAEMPTRSILERCHAVLAAMWIMGKCWLSCDSSLSMGH